MLHNSLRTENESRKKFDDFSEKFFGSDRKTKSIASVLMILRESSIDFENIRE
jgi:hypothetical protein